MPTPAHFKLYLLWVALQKDAPFLKNRLSQQRHLLLKIKAHKVLTFVLSENKPYNAQTRWYISFEGVFGREE